MYASFYIILFQTSTNKSHKNKQALKIDRTIRPQRPHDPASTTARSGLNDRTIPAGFPEGFGLLKKRFGLLMKTPKRINENVSAFFPDI